MPFDLPTLKAFEATVSRTVPAFKLGYKDQSFTQKAIGFLFPENPGYMTSFITTFYPTVYFPSQADYESNPESSLNVLAHELVHLVDTVAHPIWFRISYAFPQLLALLGFVTFGVLAGAHAWILGIALGAYLLACALAKVSMPLYYIVAIGGVVATLVLAFLMTHWLSLVLLAGFVAAVPWPSATRANWELRGYSMQLAIMQWVYGEVPTAFRQWVLSNFTGSAYYFMTWNGASMSAKIDAVCNQAKYGQLLSSPYGVVYDFLIAQGMVKK